MGRYEVTTFRVALAVQEAPEPATSVSAAKGILRSIYTDLDADREHFTVLALDNKNRVIGYKVVHTGGLNSSLVDPKTVFRAALLLGACAVIVAHNHPGGDPRPSAEDRAVTEQLKQEGNVLDLRLLDHIILGHEREWSFAEAGDLA